MNKLSNSRFDESFEGRFKKEFCEGDLFDRVDRLIGGKVDNGFIRRWINGLMDVKDYEWVFGKVLLNELRLFWLEDNELRLRR